METSPQEGHSSPPPKLQSSRTGVLAGDLGTHHPPAPFYRWGS